MIVIITEFARVPKIIDVELPYYYEHDLSGEYDEDVIYGKIELDKSTKIHLNHCGSKVVEVIMEIHTHQSIENSGLGSYFKDEHKSSKKRFDTARNTAAAFLAQISE